MKRIIRDEKTYRNDNEYRPDYKKEGYRPFLLFLLLTVIVKSSVFALCDVAAEQIYEHMEAESENIEQAAVAGKYQCSYAREYHPGTKKESDSICITWTVSVSVNTPFAPIIASAIAAPISADMP